MANQAVIDIRAVRAGLEEKVTSNDLQANSITAVVEKMTKIEEDLYQVKNQRNGEKINLQFRLLLLSLFSSLKAVIIST